MVAGKLTVLIAVESRFTLIAMRPDLNLKCSYTRNELNDVGHRGTFDVRSFKFLA